MGIETALLIGGLASAATAGVGIYNGQKQAGQQRDALATQEANAKKTATAAEEAANKANQKRPDGTALLSANQDAGKAGISGTMLTGAGGIDPSLLQLGKTTLLGGGG